LLRFALVALAVGVTQAAVAAVPALAVDHNSRIREVYAGANTGPSGVQFVELQMAAGGQNLVQGNKLHVYDAAGSLITTSTFSANLANGTNQSSILAATSQAQSFFGVTADLTIPATIPPGGGQVCYEDVDNSTMGFIDCVAWGSFLGVSPSPTGNPFNPAGGIPTGKSIERDISAGSATALETGPGGGPGGDDTDDSAADFDAIFPVGPATTTGGSPGPENNAGATTTTAGDAFVDAGGQLDFVAETGVKNKLGVAAAGSFWRLTDQAAPIEAGAGCEQLTVNRVRCSQAGVTGLTVNGDDLNDKLTTPDGIDATVDGGAGDDTITTGNGSDSLLGAAGADTFDGGAGPDTFDGGDAKDVVTYFRRTAAQPVEVDLDGDAGDDGGALDDDGTGVRDTVLMTVERAKGGAGDDALTGDDGTNVLTGGAGDDDLFGLGGNDELRANGDGAAVDEINCGPGGSDLVFPDPSDVFLEPPDPDACEVVR
jgi:hypothetical protein